MKHKLLLATLMATTQAFAWGDLGHGAVGYIAEKNLTPEGRNFVHQTLGIESLAYAALFADSVRSDDRFKSFSPYHYFDIPEGYTYETIPPDKIPAQSAQTIIGQVPAILISNRYTPEQRAILFKYLVHIVGDVHQPLHVGNDLDQGGNLCDVKWTDPVSGQLRSINLHAAWDENLIQNINADVQKAAGRAPGSRFFGYRELGDAILAELAPDTSGVTYANATSVDIPGWYTESHSLTTTLYPDATPSRPGERPYCKKLDANGKMTDGIYDPSKVPTLDAAYIARELPVVKTQILLGGYRLAGLINKIAAARKTPALGDAVQPDLLNEILLKDPPPSQPQAKLLKVKKKNRK